MRIAQTADALIGDKIGGVVRESASGGLGHPLRVPYLNRVTLKVFDYIIEILRQLHQRIVYITLAVRGEPPCSCGLFPIV